MTLSWTSAGMYFRRHFDWTRPNVFILDVSNLGDPEPQQAQAVQHFRSNQNVRFQLSASASDPSRMHDSSARWSQGEFSSQWLSLGILEPKMNKADRDQEICNQNIDILLALCGDGVALLGQSRYPAKMSLRNSISGPQRESAATTASGKV